MMSNGLVSADDHVQEHPEVWTARMSQARWGSRIPHVETLADGTERWVVDELPLSHVGIASAGALMPDRTSEPTRWQDVPAEAHTPADRLKAMDTDGVQASVLYPTVAGVGGEVFGRLTDPDLEAACVQAYNDWLIDEWAAVSPRFVPQCIVPLSPAAATVAEIRRAVGRGHRGVVFPSVPMELRDAPHINGPEYDPIWSVCEELGVPICFHAGASTATQIPAYAGWSPAVAAAFGSITRSASLTAVVVNFLISQILVRHPLLKVVFSESALGWGACLLEFTDHQAEEDGLAREGFPMRPSEMFQRQCYLTGWYDRAAIQTRRFIGTSNILWSTNFPLATSTWPATAAVVERCFAGVPEAERQQMLSGNAAELYRL
jgi:uncharacterized protein